MAKTKTDQSKDKQKTMSRKKEIKRVRRTKQREVESTGGFQIGRKRMFKDGAELLDLFNLYLASIQKEDALEMKRVFTETPTKLKFYVFLGGIKSSTWTDYKEREEFSEVITVIENFLESVLESGGLAGDYNSSMAQFVLNTSYGRNPKSIENQNRDVNITFTE